MIRRLYYGALECPECEEELTPEIRYIPVNKMEDVLAYEEVCDGYVCMSCGWDTKEGMHNAKTRKEN
tara:strand:+ start:223 stop:423 length:201 start_codon:yes stop_codon:yes gene_type:complete